MSQPLNVGVVGATGLVGEAFLQLLNERRFPLGNLKLFASDRSRGTKIDFFGKTYEVQSLTEKSFDGLDLVFFSSGDDISKEWAPRAVHAGAFAIDNSAAFRMNPETLLVVPEVNGRLLPKAGKPALIANPNCSTIQLAVTLAPLASDFGVESVHVASYQSVSGAGRAGQDELERQLHSLLHDQTPPTPQTFPHPIAFNCIPQIGAFNAQGFSSEEMKIRQESRKILGLDDLRVSAFTVRVPSWNGHSEAVWVRLKKELTREEVLTSLKKQPGLTVEDVPDQAIYPTAVRWSGRDGVAVGRIHQDLEDRQTWLMWIVSDNLRKGAALNGIQIAERIFDIG